MSGSVLLHERPVKPQSIEQTTVGPAPSFFSDLVHAVFVRKPEKPGFTVLVTSPESGCGVSFISTCIVAEVASYGAKVLLADATSLGQVRDVRHAAACCERVGTGRISVLGHQQTTSHPKGAFDPVSPLAVLAELQQEFSYIVLDAPALSFSDLPLLLATSVAGVILVARAGNTEADALASSCRRLTALGGHVFGSVYNAC